jgi:hypothetical protein
MSIVNDRNAHLIINWFIEYHIQALLKEFSFTPRGLWSVRLFKLGYIW